jgi:cell wall assembly regulator SMI1
MRETWQRLESWFAIHYPAMLSDLNVGCEPASLKDLEEKIGLELPETFKDFYAVHDGQKAKNYIGIFYDVSLLPLPAIYAQWKGWVDLIDEWGFEAMEDKFDRYQASLMPQKVKAMYANKKWIPFAVIWDCNYLGLDFDPGPDGKCGQVINFGREEEQKTVLANSFGEFIEKYVQELEAGEAEMKENGGQLSFFPTRFKWRFEGRGTRLLGYVAHRFIGEPTREELEKLGILL